MSPPHTVVAPRRVMGRHLVPSHRTTPSDASKDAQAVADVHDTLVPWKPFDGFMVIGDDQLVPFQRTDTPLAVTMQKVDDVHETS
jgi:hypothetical protein